ncbi:MAG: hypothetical protein NC823_01355 [Candidatus Omnitrophica bacterium]|nr:hypothetical protein [Candidatus Omnitrophota bacterium]
MTVEQIQTLLVQAEKKDRLATSYVLTGGSPAQREKLALFFSQLLVCEGNRNKPCGRCQACRQAKKHQHPDIQWIVPEKSSLSIDAVRKVKEEIYLRPFSSDRKGYFFFIETMKEEAANSFLKILEEPPSYGHLIIICANIHLFLPTILSRCQQLRINYFLPALDKAMKESHTCLLSFISTLKKGALPDFFQQVAALVKNLERQDLEKWLDNVLWLYRDELLRNHWASPELLITQNSCDILNQVGNILAKTELILEMRQRIRLNINLKIALEYLLLALTVPEQESC